MRSISCISLSSPSHEPSPSLAHHIPADTYKHDTRTTVLESKGPKFQTIIQVLKCELARPGRFPPSNVDENASVPSKGWKPVQYAAHYDRQAALLHFLRAGQSPDGTPGSGDSPLCIAVAAGHIEIIKSLCDAGADVNIPTQEKHETPLHLAIKSGRTDIVDVLLPYGSNVNARTKLSNETPLHYAVAKAGCLATVINLLKSGADYGALNAESCTPAEVAIRVQNMHAAVAIINSTRGKRNVLVKEKEMLMKQVENSPNRFSLTNELIFDLFETSCHPESTVLLEAIKRDDWSLARMFLERGADPNRAGSAGLHPIFAALALSGAKMVQLLVKHDVDLTTRDTAGLNVLQAALESPSAHDREAILGIFEALLSGGADAKVVYNDGTTLLHHAVSTGYELSKVAQLLIRHGVDANKPDNAGCTPLHVAGHSKTCLEVLLKYRADPEITNYAGLTPLLSAVSSATKDSETALEPLVKISDLRALDSKQKTALHIAAERGLDWTVRALLKCRAETTLADNEGRTPLLLAVLKQQWAIIPVLATQPGVNTWDKEGMTALHHLSRSIPQPPATWKAAASAVEKFCERGASRSMRDRSGATALIQAVKSLPEDGLAVIEVLLADTTGGRGNCIDHEDHKQRSALYFAATLGKPSFVKALLASGAFVDYKAWAKPDSNFQAKTEAEKQVLKLIAEAEWLRRAALLQRQSGIASSASIMPRVLPIRDLKELLSMGLNPNVLPFPAKSTYSGLLLWLVLNQVSHSPPLPSKYLFTVMKLLFAHGADPNTTAVRNSGGSFTSSKSGSDTSLGCHPLAFLLEQNPTVEIDLITLFLDNGSNLTTPSPHYEGRYPLHSAVRANRMDIVDTFIIRRADVNSVDHKNKTPLFIAAEQRFWESTQLLLQKGAKVDVKDAEGRSPLHAAARGGNMNIVSLLLSRGAKALAKSSKGDTPRSLISETLAEEEKRRVLSSLKNAEEQERREDERKAERLKQEAIIEGRMKRQRELEQQRKHSQALALKSMSVERPALPAATSTSSFVSFNTQTKPTTIKASTVNTASTASQKGLKTEKPLPQPRVDSGFGFAQQTEKSLPVLDRSKKSFSGADASNTEEDNNELMGWLAVSKVLDRL